MFKRFVANMGLKRFGRAVQNPMNAADEAQRRFGLPASYCKLLATIGGAVMFTRCAKYRPSRRTPLTGADGYDSLEMLYGLGSGKFSIQHAARTYSHSLKPDLTPIGEAPGGNVLCCDRKGVVYLWIHDRDPIDRDLWRVAPSINTFLAKLVPDDEPPSEGDDGILECVLDF